MAAFGGIFRQKGMKLLISAVVLLALYATPAWAQPSLAITKTDDPDTVTVGHDITYTINVTASGGDAQNVKVTDPLPANTTFRSVELVSPDTGDVCTAPSEGASSGTVKCDLGTVTDGETEAVKLVVRPTAAAGEEGSVTNTATAEGKDIKPVSASQNTTVDPLDLTIEKNDFPDPVNVGQNLLYTLTVTNQTGQDNLDLQVRDKLPSQLDFLDANINVPGGTGNCTEANNEVRCTINDLDTGTSNAATIQILTQALQTGTLQNTARVFCRDNAGSSVCLKEDRFTPIAEDTEATTVQGSNTNGNGNGARIRAICSQILQLTTGDQQNNQNSTVTGGQGGRGGDALGGQGGNGGRGGDASANQNANFGNNTVNQLQRCLNNNGSGNSSNQTSDQYGNGTLQYDDTTGNGDTGTSATPDTTSTDTTSTPDNGGGVVSDAGSTNPDTLPPQGPDNPRGPVDTQVPFNEPLPPTFGISPVLLLGWAGFLIAAAGLAAWKLAKS